MSADPIVRKLRVERFKAGRSQRSVGAEAGVGQSMVSEWESGSVVPTLTSVRSWAAALGFELILIEVPAEGPGSTSPEPGPDPLGSPTGAAERARAAAEQLPTVGRWGAESTKDGT